MFVCIVLRHFHSKCAVCSDELLWIVSIIQGGGGGTSGAVGGKSLTRFFWVLPKRSIPK